MAGFTRSCTLEVGRLLRVLAEQVRGGIIAEIGTGSGVGAAWIVSGLAADTRFISVELDATLAAGSRALFADYPHVEVRTGDWRDILPFAPFALLFADAAAAKDDGGALYNALAQGGMIVLDDLSPEDQWPPEWRGHIDPIRTYWLNHPGVYATEILTTATTAAILAVRIA